MKKRILVFGAIAALAAAASWLWPERREAPVSTLPLLTGHLLRSGLQAAREKNWPEAIVSFRHAHACSPRELGPVYYLALAHDHADHRMVALCWYEALSALAPEGKYRAFSGKRARELDSLIRSDITKLATAGLEIATIEAEATRETAPTKADLLLLSHLRTAALAEGLLGDPDRAMKLLNQIQNLDPEDHLWTQTSSLVGRTLADQGRFDGAERIAGSISSTHATVIREHMARVKESRQDPGSGSWMKDLNPADIVHHWSTYADAIVSGTHHQRHVMDLFAVDPLAKQEAAPEMGLTPYFASLRWRTTPPGAGDVMDGVKRLCLTYREIRNWRSQ